MASPRGILPGSVSTILYAGTFNREIEGPAFASHQIGGIHGLVAGQN